MTKALRVGFIGLGSMGAGMAHNIRKAGYPMVVHDVRPASARALLDQGASWAESPARLGADVDVAFTSLPGPHEMEAVALGHNGLLEGMKTGSAWFDLSTNSATVVRRVCERFARNGIDVLDAPVSGGPAGARSGKLALYVGGKREVFERHKALLDSFGDQAMYVGPIGAGTIAKLAHNCAGFVVRTAIAEVFALGVKGGVDPLALWHALRQGAVGRRRTFDGIEGFLQNKYEPPGMVLRLAHKDMTLATDLAHELGASMPLADVTLTEMTEALDRGWGHLDGRSSMKLALERSHVTIEESAEAVSAARARGD